MVSASDRISNMFQNKAGLVEACLIPYLEIFEMNILASMSKKIRKLFDPKSNHHLNFFIMFSKRLQID